MSAERAFLMKLNPLATFAAALPAIIALVFVRDLVTPLALIALSYAVLLAGARLSRSAWLLVFAVVPVAVVVLTAGFAVWTDPARVSHDVVVLQLGEWRLYGAAVQSAAATALRLAAITMLAFIGGLTTTGTQLVRAMTQHLRLPYRIGYTALAAFRFVPRFGRELEIIRAAHRVRGAAEGRGPIAATRRRLGYIVPLLAGAIRHAERVALAMDARAFGAHPTRTERHLVPLRIRDAVFVALFWVVSAVILIALFPWGR